MQLADINKLIDELTNQLKGIKNEKLAIETRNIFIKKHLTPLYDQLKLVSNDAKREFGIVINLFKNKINEVTDK